MAAAAAAFLGSLSPGQAAKARLPIDSPERREWYYTPTAQSGLPLLEMGPLQVGLAMQLLAAGLSGGAYNAAATIMGLEHVLDRRERWRATFSGYEAESRGRDPLLYFVTVFGEPGSGRWGWRFGGHHISINYTVTAGRVAATPSFLGANPAATKGLGATLLRPLAGEEDLGRELLHALSPEQRVLAVLAPAPPTDMVQSNRPVVEDGALPLPLDAMFRGLAPPRRRATERAETAIAEAVGLSPAQLEAVRYTRVPKGIPGAAMTPAQRAGLAELVRHYLARLPDDLAGPAADQVLSRIDEVHFAWAGAGEPGRPHYYRLQGPRLLIEYDNVQDGANHIHSAWRDPEGDWGDDPLMAHHAAAHSGP
jgi:hypothetical protein